MPKYKVAVLGCGGRGREHAAGFAASPDAAIVACADAVEESAVALAKNYPGCAPYTEYRTLLEEHHPDVVSVCTWPHLHLPMVEAAVAAGARAVHCEKPMAPTWGDARAMHNACEGPGVLLTLCHQRRFGAEYRGARDRIADGTIGDLIRIEARCPNLFDWGTHWFDMFHFFNADRQALWVLGQIDVAATRTVFGVPVETSGVSLSAWDNGISTTLYTGHGKDGPRISNVFDSEGLVVHGSSGRIDVSHRRLRVAIEGRPAADIPVTQAQSDTTLSCLDLLKCLETGDEPELSSFRALKATELIFATYESSRQRGRVTLPLAIEDSPLISGLQQGLWNPPPPEPRSK